MDEEKKTRGGPRPGAGRKPGGQGRKRGVFVALDQAQYEWVQEQPEGPPAYLRRLSDEDQKLRGGNQNG